MKYRMVLKNINLEFYNQCLFACLVIDAKNMVHKPRF